MFIKIPYAFINAVAGDDDRMRLYITGNVVMRWFFWLRLRAIYWAIRRFGKAAGTCLDFGGGSGVLLPTLANYFHGVTCVDMDNIEAAAVVDKYALSNVSLVTGDIAEVRLDGAPFAAIVAADVLEHFPDLDAPVAALRKWLADDGLLFTSLPTENFVYKFLRVVFGVTAPEDHYHTGYAVEAFLQRNGFSRRHRWFVPLFFRLFPLFIISVWERSPSADGASQ